MTGGWAGCFWQAVGQNLRVLVVSRVFFAGCFIVSKVFYAVFYWFLEVVEAL